MDNQYGRNFFDTNMNKIKIKQLLILILFMIYLILLNELEKGVIYWILIRYQGGFFLWNRRMLHS